MIYSIVMYGDPILRKKGQNIEAGLHDVKALAADMFETMSTAEGIGLAAPQVGKNLRLFVVDTSLLNLGKDPGVKGFKKVFINPEMVEKNTVISDIEEGCLSIPGIRERVSRPEKIRIKFFDTDWNLHEEEYEGMKARIIQHEYDHIEGILFIDHLASIKRRLLRKRLSQVSKGEVNVAYRISLLTH